MPHLTADVTQYCHRDHPGAWDIDFDQGTLLYAPRAGIVRVRKLTYSYGWYIRLDDGPVSIYLAHLSQILVNDGQRVVKGQRIARSGGEPGEPGSGNSTGSHLHFEVRINDSHVGCSQVDDYIGALCHPLGEEEDDEVVLIRIGGEPTVYACLWGFKVAVPSATVFEKMGGDWSKVYGVNSAHPLAKLPTLNP